MLYQELPISTSSSTPSTAGPHKASRFSGLVIKEQINQAKFPVLLAYSPSYDRHFALKIFPYKSDEVSKFFLNEARFMGMEHPNVISTVHCENEKIIPSRNKRMRVSYTVMELAPYGDFYDVLMTKKVQFSDTLARTYFRQLIEGLEYLHSNGVAHLDIKPENLLVGEDFQLKITDFDHSSLNGSVVVPSVGTSFYRAPEIANSTNYSDHRAADIYSAAVMLFLFKTSGFLPHLEHNLYEGVDLFDLLNNNNSLFWETHCKIQGRPLNFFEQEFCELFNWMTHIDPQQRATIEEIKTSKWYNGPIYDDEELAGRMAEELDA